MKEYKMVYINKGVCFSRMKDLKKSEDVLNEYVANGWELQEIVSPNDGMGAMIAVMFRETTRETGCSDDKQDG